MVGPKRPQFVIFGSSIVQFCYSFQGWGSILTDLYARKADILLRGYAGWNSRRGLQVLEQVFPKDAAVQPALVLVYFGGNDCSSPNPNGLGAHVPLDEYVENMKKIAIHLKSLSEKTRVIFLTTPPVNESQMVNVFGAEIGLMGRTNEACRAYSEACLKLCAELDVKAVDLWTSLQQRDDWSTVSFTDGIHLSAEGSKIVAKEVLKVLKGADWTPNLHWRSLPAEFNEDSPYDFVGAGGKNVNTSDIVRRWQTEWE